MMKTVEEVNATVFTCSHIDSLTGDSFPPDGLSASTEKNYLLKLYYFPVSILQSFLNNGFAAASFRTYSLTLYMINEPQL